MRAVGYGGRKRATTNAWTTPYDDLSKKLRGQNKIRLLSGFAENSALFGAFRNIITLLASRANWRIVPYNYEELQEQEAERKGLEQQSRDMAVQKQQSDEESTRRQTEEKAKPRPGPKAETTPPTQPAGRPEPGQPAPAPGMPGVPTAPEAEAEDERVIFLNEVIQDMVRPIEDVVAEAILNCVIYGWSFQEEVYKKRQGPRGRVPSIFDDGQVGLKKVAPRPAETTRGWIFNEEDDLIGMEQWVENQYVVIPIDKAVHVVSEPGYSPEGRSALRNAYATWCRLAVIENVQEIGIERELAGLPIAQPKTVNPSLPAPDLWNENDPNAAETLEALTEMVQNIRNNEDRGLVLPETIDLRLLSSSGQRQIDIGTAMDRFDFLIASSWIMDALLLGSQAGGGFALARVKMKLGLSVMDGLLTRFETSFRRGCITRLMRFNSMEETDVPRLYHDPLDQLADELVKPGTGGGEDKGDSTANAKGEVRPRVAGEDK